MTLDQVFLFLYYLFFTYDARLWGMLGFDVSILGPSDSVPWHLDVPIDLWIFVVMLISITMMFSRVFRLIMKMY